MRRNFIAWHFEIQDPQKARWLPMEGLRGIAVLLVFFVHYSSGMAPYFGPKGKDLWWIAGIHEIGNSGVDLFFVLSGFLIYKAVIHRPINYRKYAYRRIERIYPVFLAVLLLYVLLSYAFPHLSRIPMGWPDAFAYLMANVLLLPGMFSIEPIITVAWSLSYEAFYYILVPLLVAILQMRLWRSQQRIAFLLGLYLIYIVAQSLELATHFRLTMFFGGILLYEIVYGLGMVPKGRDSAWPDRLALALFVGGLAFFTLLGASRWMLGTSWLAALPPFLKYVLLNAALVYLIYRSLFASGPAGKLFSFTPLRWLGNMSYTYYLMHSLGLHIFFKALHVFAPSLQGSIAAYIALVPVAVIVTIAVSVPVYLFIEHPFSLRRRPATSETPVSGTT